MSNEELTEEILMKAYKRGIVKEVFDLASHYIQNLKMNSHDAYVKAYESLKQQK